jgi:hypothetical protein
MTPVLAAAIIALASPAAEADAKIEIASACRKAPASGVSNGEHETFCRCFAEKTAADAVALGGDKRALFVIVTEFAGDPGKAQKAAETQMSVNVEAFVRAWESIDPMGRKAGAACMPKKDL